MLKNQEISALIEDVTDMISRKYRIDRDEIKSITGDAFIAASGNVDNSRGDIYRLTYGIANRKLIDYIRKNGEFTRNGQRRVIDEYPTNIPYIDLGDYQLADCVDQLPEPHRSIIIDVFVDGIEPTSLAIASKYKISRWSVYRKYTKALQTLRHMVENDKHSKTTI